MEGLTFATKAEDLKHVWIPLSMKMSISKSQGLEVSSWPEGEEVSPGAATAWPLPASLKITCRDGEAKYTAS